MGLSEPTDIPLSSPGIPLPYPYPHSVYKNK
jgi:hypothetical protein